MTEMFQAYLRYKRDAKPPWGGHMGALDVQTSAKHWVLGETRARMRV